MANETRYYDTPYTFISPVRHFKSNDPYYYEVDNIPIKQLEESQKFLKDQVDGIITRQNNKKEIEIDRSNFSELKPYATGNDRKVRVKPGKFTARINNAYALTPLQVVAQIEGFSNIDRTTEGINKWRVDTNIGSYVSGVLQQFQEGRLGDALNMNGLAERAFTFPIWDEDGFHLANTALVGAAISGTTTPGYSQFDGDFDPDDRSLYPNYIGAILKHSTPETTRDLTLIKDVYTSQGPSAGQQGRTESEFIKRWRGAIRTSIVDVPEELSITVPDFDLADYFYTDADGNNQPLDARHRIDLLFIYSKAVDEESTTIPKFDSNGNPTTLTQPALGILKGAGIGISRQTATNDDNADDRVSLQTLDGTPIMLAHPGDERGSNTGFSVVSGTGVGTIKGSFPSPDDLMNLAPMLSENLETTAFQLIGQSILPIAYVRVQTAAGAIADILNDEDIIDIRPFFRTTELAYNERAGIAAATPQVSIANPVVTEVHLEKVRKEVVHDLRTRIDNVGGQFNSNTRIIGVGTITGGIFGAEGALMRQSAENIAGGIQSTGLNDLADQVEQEFSYPAGSVGRFPQWDKADWYTQGGFTGNFICDHINLGLGWCTQPAGAGGVANTAWLAPATGGFPGGSPTINELKGNATWASRGGIANFGWGTNYSNFLAGSLPYGSFLSVGGGAIGSIQTRSEAGWNSFIIPQPVLDPEDIVTLGGDRASQIYFVRKRIKLNFTNTPWVTDYHVNANLLNCVPLSQNNIPGTAQSSNIWINKYKDYFVINVAWVGPAWTAGIMPGAGAKPWANRNLVSHFTGFTLPEVPVIGNSPFKQTPPVLPKKDLVSNSSKITEFFNQCVNLDVAPTADEYAAPSWLTALHPLLYPSVTFEVIGIVSNNMTGGTMYQKDPTLTCV